jgi:hypothetical protein
MRLSLFTAALSLGLFACSTEEPADELAGESDEDGEVGKGDSAAAFDFFAADPDLRACSFDARCGGFFVSRPNRASTICGRGSQAARCYVDSLDWSGTALPDSVARGYEEALRNGEKLILKGTIAPHPADAGSVFAVTEVWLPRSATGVNEGVAVLVKDNGVRCITAPCPSLTEFRVNSNRFADITDLDLAASGADERALEIGSSALYDDGVLVFGDRYYPTKGAKGRAANQFYTRAPVPMF